MLRVGGKEKGGRAEREAREGLRKKSIYRASIPKAYPLENPILKELATKKNGGEKRGQIARGPIYYYYGCEVFWMTLRQWMQGGGQREGAMGKGPQNWPYWERGERSKRLGMMGALNDSGGGEKERRPNQQSEECVG